MKYIFGILVFLYTSLEVCRYEKPHTPPPSLTQKQVSKVDGIDILASIISAEALGESYKGKLAVASVVLNRVDSEQFPQSIEEVVFQKNQFSGIYSPLYNKPSKDCYLAARDAIEGKRVTKALYYANVSTATNTGWVKHIQSLSKSTQKIGNHTFFLI